MSNMTIPALIPTRMGGIQEVVHNKEPDVLKDMQGANGEVAKDDKSDGDDNLNMFSGVLGLASGSKTEGKEGGGGRSEVENLQTLLESLFQKLSGGGDSDKPHKAHNAGDGQLSAGPGLADMPSLLPSGSKSVDNPEQAADMPSKAEGDQKFEDKLRSIVLPGHGIELHGL